MPGALALVTAGYALRAQRWRLYLRVMGHPADARTGGLVFLSGFAFGVTPGKLGEMAKAWYARRASGVPYAASLPAVLAERVNDLVAVVALLALSLPWAPREAWLPAGAGALAVLGGIVLLRSDRLADLFARTLSRVRRLERASKALRDAHANLAPLLRGRALAAATALGVLGWAVEVAAMRLLAAGLGIDVSLGVCAFVFTAGTLLGVASLLPGGLGVAEGGMVLLLRAQGVGLPEATALTLLVRLCTLWWGVLVGLLAIGALRPAKP